MTSSSRREPRQVPAPGAKPASPYARFIPREELSSFSAWTPDALSGGDAPAATGLVPGADASPAEAAVESLEAALQAARQSGYQDGYRDGLVALEGFKRSFAQQMTAQLGALLRSVDEQLGAMEEQMAEALAHAAMDLAGQVVRHELTVQPELVAGVAREAVSGVMLSARHITLRVHPDDAPLVAQGAGDELERRGARLVAPPPLSRGGCIVESDVGIVEAGIENRWRRAAAALGGEVNEDGEDGTL